MDASPDVRPADPLGRSGPSAHLNELVFRTLQDHILRAVFQDGLVLRQNAIAETFGVGRAPAAMALRKLEAAGLVRKRLGHGYIVARNAVAPEPVALALTAAGLTLPHRFQDALKHRKRKGLIYPEVERAVASCLVFGRFRINQSALAEHFGVSRTVAREILTSLEGAGFARLGRNARWYAGPLTFEGIKESYEMRWLLEPAALRQAAPSFTVGELAAMRRHLDQVLERGRFEPAEMEQIEAELHNDLVLRCTNGQMRQILVRCQLPIIATFGTVLRDPERSGFASGLPEALTDHGVVLDHLLHGDIDAAAAALEAHLRNAFALCAPHFETLPPLTDGQIPPYMSLEA